MINWYIFTLRNKGRLSLFFYAARKMVVGGTKIIQGSKALKESPPLAHWDLPLVRQGNHQEFQGSHHQGNLDAPLAPAGGVRRP